MIKDVCKENYVEIASSLNNIGLCYLSISDKQNALNYLEDSLRISRKFIRENHSDIALYLHNIGYYYQKIGKYSCSLVYLIKSLNKRI